jgi:hypothetical protein
MCANVFDPDKPSRCGVVRDNIDHSSYFGAGALSDAGVKRRSLPALGSDAGAVQAFHALVR